MSGHPHPERAFDLVMGAGTPKEAQARLTELLAKAWEAGRQAGEQENDDFHTDHEPPREARNPYRRR